VNLWYPACADRYFADLADPPVKLPELGPDAYDEHGAPSAPSLDQDGEGQGAIRVCAQCRSGSLSDPPTIEVTSKDSERLWVHRECLRFWEREHPQQKHNIDAPADTGDTVVNFPAPVGSAAKPSYEVVGWTRPGSQCGLCGKPVSVYRIKYGGREYTVHLRCADEFVKALAHPPLAAQPESVPRRP
jgi:hypothetical protein